MSSGCSMASFAEIWPPIELPMSVAVSMPSLWSSAMSTSQYRPMVSSDGSIGERPNPGRSRAITRCWRASWGMFSSQFIQLPESPCTITIAGPAPTST